MKTCARCGVGKELDEFQRDRSRKDGRQNYCRKCRYEVASLYRQTPRGREARRAYRQTPNGREARREADRRYEQTPQRREAKRKYRQTPAGREVRREFHRRYRQNPDHRPSILARLALNKAVYAGEVARGSCAHCGTTSRIEAHHPDYSKPLDVVWLCRFHHRELHNKSPGRDPGALESRRAGRQREGNTMAEGTMQHEQERALVPAEQVGRDVAQVVPKAALPIFQGAIQPADFDGLYRLSRAIAASGLTPQGIKTPEQVFVALAQGLEVGLSPMASLQNIAVVNGRPTIWGDSLLALVERSGELGAFEETFTGQPYADPFAAVCRATRKYPDGRTRSTEEAFSVEDAKLAGLWGKAGPWKQYPKRMMKYRARSFALRDLFPDVLKGLRTTEEMQDAPRVVDSAPGSVFEAEEVRAPAQPAPAVPVLDVVPADEPETPAPPKRTRRAKAPAEAPQAAPVAAEVADATAEPNPWDEEQTAAPASSPETPPAGAPALGEVVKTRFGEGTVSRYTEDEEGRGPIFWLLLEDGREMPFYAREFQASASAVRQPGEPTKPAAAPQGSGSGFVLCKGVHGGRMVSLLAVCDRCPEVLGCAEFKAGREKIAANANGNSEAGASKPVARKLF